MNVRPALALALCATVVGGGVAGAAPKAKPKAAPPVCNLLEDAKDDGAVDGGALEIVGGDIATSKKQLTAVIRVAKASTSSTTAPTGLKWQMIFSVGDANLFASVLSDQLNGVTANYGYFDGTSGNIEGTATGVIDQAKNEIRVTVPTGAFSTASIKPGVKITKIGASAVSVLQAPTGVANLRVFSNDSAATEKTYDAGAASCVAVGT
ncbi:MAG: hypothetical protein JWN77_207 [Frankiales bacterium]|nr:hypothetical protein [Frankiales bacterium]